MDPGRWPFKKYVVRQVSNHQILLSNMKSKLKKNFFRYLMVFDKIVTIQNRIQKRIRTRIFEF
jgi:hypothetical protein